MADLSQLLQSARLQAGTSLMIGVAFLFTMLTLCPLRLTATRTEAASKMHDSRQTVVCGDGDPGSSPPVCAYHNHATINNPKTRLASTVSQVPSPEPDSDTVMMMCTPPDGSFSCGLRASPTTPKSSLQLYHSSGSGASKAGGRRLRHAHHPAPTPPRHGPRARPYVPYLQAYVPA